MLPNFLIIGAPRSGTTWLEKNLREHPDVFMPRVKELHFFDTHYDKGIPWYESQFDGGGKSIAVGEATPDYLHGAYSSNPIPELIKKHLPEVKLIVSLRDPVERAYSRFLNSKARFDSNRYKTFEQQLEDSPEFIEEGLYYDQLSRYYAHFRDDQILVLLYDDLVADPKSYITRVYNFLAVRSDIESGWEQIRVNRASGKGNLAKSAMLVFLTRGLARLRLHDTAERLTQFNTVSEPPMSRETRHRLSAVYKEQNGRLAELIGRDLSSWT